MVKVDYGRILNKSQKHTVNMVYIGKIERLATTTACCIRSAHCKAEISLNDNNAVWKAGKTRFLYLYFAVCFVFLAVQNSSIGLIVPLSDPTNNQSLHNTTE